MSQTSLKKSRSLSAGQFASASCFVLSLLFQQIWFIQPHGTEEQEQELGGGGGGGGEGGGGRGGGGGKEGKGGGGVFFFPQWGVWF